MGSGKGGSFSLSPDYKQWSLLAVWDNLQNQHDFAANSFVAKWWSRFAHETYTILLSPLSSKGTWDGQQPFKPDQPNETIGPVAVLTRATIRFSKLKRFWSHVDQAAQDMQGSPGYIISFGVGEAPVVKQATFSVWTSMDAMMEYAYGSANHREVIKKTREENWYLEELFARFKVISASGTLNGVDPLSELKTKDNESIS